MHPLKSRIWLSLAALCCLAFVAARGFEQDTYVIATDDDGSANTTGIVVNDKAFGTVHYPAALTGATLAIEGKCGADDDWAPILDSAGDPLTLTFTADSIQRLPDEAFGVNRIRLVSDDTEVAARTFYFHVQE